MSDEGPTPTSGHVEAGGVRLHYVDWGNRGAPAMVLLHGLQDCARSWDSFAASMSANYHVVALDHRGHGDSGRATSETYGLRHYVSDVHALVDHLGLRSITLVGHSAGGRNAFMFALDRPELVRALVIVDIDPDAVNPDSRQMFVRYNTESDEWESLDAVVERLRSRQPNSSEEMLAHQALHMTSELAGGRRAWKRDRALLAAYERPDLWAEWSRLRCPTLVLRGRQSELLTHEVAVRMREAVPGARLAELEGGAHWFYQEQPSDFEGAVRWFLDEVDSPPY